MGSQVQISEHVVMRDFYSSPVARALRTGMRLTMKTLFLSAVLFLAIPSSGPDIPVRIIPDYSRTWSLATMVSSQQPDEGFTRYEYSWVAPPRFNWDYFADLDNSAVADVPPETAQEVEQTASTVDAPAPDTIASAFFVPDSFGVSGWDFTAPDGSFVLAARPNPHPTPEPQSSILIATGIAGFALAAFYRRKRLAGARQRV
jgi:hypothetical protein